MNTSPNIDLIIGPWMKVLHELGNVARDNTGHHGTYATINSVLSTIKPILETNGLAIQQTCETTETGVVIRTHLWHTSGQWIEDDGLRMPAPNDPQKIGGSLTYGRRYALLTFFALGTVDDDGHEAAQGIRDDAAEALAAAELQQRVGRAHTDLHKLDDDSKEAFKEWKGDRSASEAALAGDVSWLELVESWLDERKVSG